MANFPKQLEAPTVRRNNARADSIEHHNIRLAATGQRSEGSSQCRGQDNGMWWADQRYVDQIVPSHFTDPKTFDYSKYRYQMYARHPVQCPIQSLSEVTEQEPPIRYNIKRIAIDKPFNVGSPSRCPGYTKSEVELPAISSRCQVDAQNSKTSNVEAVPESVSRHSHSCCSESRTSCTGSSSSSRSGCEHCNDDNNNNNNNNIINTILKQYNDNTDIESYSNITANQIELSRDACKKNNIITISLNDKKKSKSRSNPSSNLIFSENATLNINNNSQIRSCHQGLKPMDETKACCCHPGRFPLEVIEAFPSQNQQTCQNEVRPSTFLCRPIKACLEFPCNRLVPGKRVNRDVKDDEREVICRRIFRNDCANTLENAHLDTVDPLVVCRLKSDLPTTTTKDQPGYGTYKIIGSRQYKEPPQPTFNHVSLPEHLRKYQEFQRKYPNVSLGRYDRSSCLYEMLLPGNRSAIQLTAGLNPFQHTGNPNSNNNTEVRDREPSNCEIHWKLPTFTS